MHASCNDAQSYFFNATSHLASQEIPRRVWNKKALPWSEEPATGSYSELVYAFPQYLLEINCNAYPPIYVCVCQVISYRQVYGPQRFVSMRISFLPRTDCYTDLATCSDVILFTEFWCITLPSSGCFVNWL